MSTRWVMNSSGTRFSASDPVFGVGGGYSLGLIIDKNG